MKSYKIQIITVFGLILLLTFCISTKFFNPTNRETEKERNPITEDTNLQNSAPNEDNYEENDDSFTAYDLTSCENVWLSKIDGYGIQADDDWYKIYATAGETLYIDCLFSDDEGDIDIQLYDSGVSWVDSSLSMNDNEYIIHSVVTTGTYYIRVYYEDAGNQYDLRWYIVGPIDDNYEENDDTFTAYNLTSYENVWLSTIDGYGIQEDDDWYEIYATAGETLYIDCLFTHAEGDIDIQLYDSGGPPLLVDISASIKDDEYIIHSVVTTGTYYIRVYYDDEGNQYDLRWYIVPPIDDNYEENDVPGTRYNLTLYEYIWLQAIDGYGIQYDDDFYEIYATAGDTIYIDCLFSHAEGDINLTLFNNTGLVVATSDSVDDNEYIIYSVATTGMYIILVYGDDAGNQYDLRWYTSSTGSFDDKYEENDDTFTAYNLTSYENVWLKTIDGYGIQADDDLYEIFVPYGELHLVVKFDFSYTEGCLNFSIYNSTGAYITEFNITIDDNTIDYWFSLNGTYYILVSGENLSTIYNFKWYTDKGPQSPLLPGGGGGDDDDGGGGDKDEIIPGYDMVNLIGVMLGVSVIVLIITLKKQKYLTKLEIN